MKPISKEEQLAEATKLMKEYKMKHMNPILRKILSIIASIGKNYQDKKSKRLTKDKRKNF